jgi:hypothetical protein
MRVLLSISTIRRVVKKFPEFFDFDGLLRREFVPPGHNVTMQVLQRKLRDKWQARTVISAPSLTSLVVSSPNHRTLQISLRVTFGSSLLCTLAQEDTFRNRGGQQMECEAELRKIPTEVFRRCFQQLQDRWSKCVRDMNPTVKAIG